MDPSSRLRPVTAWFVSMDVPGAGDTVVLEHWSLNLRSLPAPTPSSGLSLAPPRGSPASGRGDRAVLTPEGRTSCRDDAPQPAEHRLAFVPRDSRGDTQSWPGRSGPSGARPSGGREGAQIGRAGRVKEAALPWRPSWAAWRGPGGQPATSVRGGERERGGGGGSLQSGRPSGPALLRCQKPRGRSQG